MRPDLLRRQAALTGNDPVLPFDYRDWSANHFWLHKQPLPLWTIALSVRAFGATETAVRLLSIRARADLSAATGGDAAATC